MLKIMLEHLNMDIKLCSIYPERGNRGFKVQQRRIYKISSINFDARCLCCMKQRQAQNSHVKINITLHTIKYNSTQEVSKQIIKFLSMVH